MTILNVQMNGYLRREGKWDDGVCVCVCVCSVCVCVCCVCVCVCVCVVCETERDRDRETERQTETETAKWGTQKNRQQTASTKGSATQLP